jgi:outer membrane protein OmpA-like peptidoglycan-associated protein
MSMNRELGWKVPTMLLALALAGCSYNPLSGNNHMTGSPVGAISGAAVGGVGVAAFGGSKPLIGAAALVGGAIGYYTTTERYDAGGIYQVGGQVYSVGQYVGIEIPTDKLFEPNTAELLPQASNTLDSVVDVLQRHPNNNILVSGNSSGFGHSRWERCLTEKRAEKIAAYLWNGGVNDFKEFSLKLRKLNYVGYGDYFPNSSNLTNRGIRENSRIQITSYPSCADLHLDSRHVTMHNIGGMDDN